METRTLTDEQIRQNAKEYAKSICPYGNYRAHTEKTFIAGAKSRDEEIGELKGEIERLKAIIAVDDLNEEALRKELDKLLNPWIKPSEQMPVNGDDIVYLLYGGSAGRMKYHSTYEKWLLESATHWMKITLKGN